MQRKRRVPAFLFSWFGNLTVHLSLGAYFWFSALMFVAWAVTVFGLDRLSYWEVTPGQLTRKSLFGSGSQSWNQLDSAKFASKLAKETPRTCFANRIA